MRKENPFADLKELMFRMSGAKEIGKVCEQHNMNWIQFKDGRANCPRCFCKNGGQAFQQGVNESIKNEQDSNIPKHLERYSIISNNKILDCTLENYKAVCDETIQAKGIAIKCAKWYKGGNNFNMVLNGNAGTGKSHLAYAIIKEVSQKRRCLFISIPKMQSLIYDSFENKDSKYTKAYFEKIMSEADILVIDDLGAEVGRIDTKKVSNDFMSTLLFNIYEARQGKSTITTSNLLGDRMKEIYDQRMTSRLKADTTDETRFTFKTAKDKR